MKVNAVLPGKLYMRGNALGIDAYVKRAALEMHGIDLVINLWSRQDPAFAMFANEGKIQYWLNPIPDAGLTLVQKLRLLDLATRATVHIREGGRVLTQCHAGRNRAGLMAALVVRAYEKIPGAEAMALVRERRPNAIANVAFESWLEGLE